ncbi:MAG: hypothetical protein H6738_14955 [Alphaproteobacteria bacterium]|nr:hypothetical protein [Alphaproteobacteria bacterium]MCB9698076.1 hypothetical protein [Alphaproteobacteria bacterium]
MIAWWSALALASECPPAHADELEQTLGRAERAYADLDEETFLHELDELAVRTPCLAEPLSPTLVARYHRAIALRLYGTSPDRALASVGASRAADPTLTLPWVAPDHPLGLAWAAAPDPATDRLPRPRHGVLWLDGEAVRARPESRAALVQWFPEGGEPTSSLVFPDDPFPSYTHVSPLRQGLAVGAVGSFALAAGAWAGALVARGDFAQPDHDLTELQRLRTTANGLAIGSGVLVLAGGGLLGASFVVDRP